MAKKKKSKANGKNKNSNSSNTVEERMILVDPARVRFQHARIRPFFSGCGRSVEETLNQIRQGQLAPSDLPPIQVLVGPDSNKNNNGDGDNDGPWYFSLNNRRLWVLKRCREEGLLDNNQIAVRVRKPKSEQEALRYTLENCALEAKIMAEKTKTAGTKVSSYTTNPAAKKHTEEDVPEDEDINAKLKPESIIADTGLRNLTISGDEDSDEESSDEEYTSSNRFSALF